MSPTSRNAMHRQFLQEIRERRAALEEELQTLDAVEKYHAQAIGEGEKKQPIAPPRVGQIVPYDPGPLAKKLQGAKKYEAAELALKHLGQPAKIGSILDVLWQCGYGTKLKRRILHNSLHTGMDRRKDIFRRCEDAFWALVEWPDDKQEETSTTE